MLVETECRIGVMSFVLFASRLKPIGPDLVTYYLV